MPAKSEYVAHGRTISEISDAIGADWMIYQNMDDLVRACKGDMETDFSNFDCSCFDGIYVTGGITDEYLDRIERIRSDEAKGSASI